MSRGADVNAQDDDWWTPLHYACEFNRSDIVQFLLAVNITSRMFSLHSVKLIDVFCWCSDDLCITVYHHIYT